MINNIIDSTSIIWMNVTTSANWTRPPVGIVRVEKELCTELSKLLGNRFKQCVWMDGDFIEWIEKEHKPSEEIHQAVELLLPKTASFDLARRFLSFTLASFRESLQTSQIAYNADTLTTSIPLKQIPRMRPSAGDILISIGLDWDQSYTSHFYHLSRKRGVKVISCCYDLIPVLFPQYCVGDVASRFKDYFSILTWGSSAVLCISEQTKKDLLNLWSEIGSPERKTCVIPLGDNVPSGTGNMSKLTQSVITENFILFVSTIERRKNHEILYKAYHLLVRMGYAQQLPKLVFVGMPGWGVGDLLKDIELDPLVQGLIIQLNHVSDAELLELYQHALFCVYPSLYEGWGLPVGEALSLGKVVLSSDQGSLPEVGGNLVKYVPAWNPQAWADAIWELVSNPNILNSLATKVKDSYVTRKWSDTAKVVSELVTELLNESQSYEQTLYPGYDFSTQCGLHVGSRLESTGESGFLMFGPFISLNPGKYHLDIVGCVKSYADNAVITFDVVSNAGKHCYAITRSNITSSTHTLDEDLSLLSIDIDLDKLVTDMEIRCIVSNKLEICLNLIKIIKIY